MSDAYLESRFPKLRSGGYKEKSLRDPKYNCIAFALGNDTLFWQWMPRRTRGYYWPIDWNNSLASWVEVFRLHGYVPCEDGEFVAGIEKIAIYVDEDRIPTHVAKQDVQIGRWISKLGKGKDIIHDTPELLAGFEVDEYGKIEQFMSRPSRSATNEKEQTRFKHKE